MIQAIIFDLDNTLTDFMTMKDLAIRGAAEAMIDAGLKKSPDETRTEINEIYREMGIEYQKVFDVYLTRTLGHIDYKMLAAGIVGYRRARDSALILYPHVHLTLVELIKRGIKLAVVSDAPREQAWLRLCYLKLQHMFDVVVTFEDTLKRKPSPEPFQRALDQLGVPAGRTLMIGDWPERDVEGAKGLGMTTVFARYGDTFGTPVGLSGADHDIADVMDLLDIVDTINGTHGR
ncbi:MAG: putative hydrolase of the HAD superfamily [bacterium]|nr:MAG: putative hydrolase of the HAD superfamily [bacterium]